MTGTTYDTDAARRTALALTLALAAGFSVWSFFILNLTGVDLLPLWLAAKFWAMGQPEMIYTIEGGAFTLSTPEAWRALATAEGVGAVDINPFIYAPIWAVLLAPLTEVMSFATFDAIVRILNPAALAIVPFCVWRAAPIAPPALIIGTGFAMLALTTVGLLPIMGGQVQIVVALLLAIAMERSRNGAPLAAGAALGLAAALKLYPALFVLLFLATRQNRAILSFALVGGGFGLASLAFAGWPLHAELLRELSVISSSVIEINLSTNLDALIVVALALEMSDGIPGRAVLVKSEMWSALSRIALLGAITALAIVGRRNPAIAQHPLYWPLAVITAAILGPLSWTFHYILPMAASALLLTLLPRAAALAVLLTVGALSSILTIALPFPSIGTTPPLQLWGSLAFLLLTFTFAALVLTAKHHPQ
ncbi:MAG: glycosyltransferase family 87 protein [Pseudomonadota bacterium]